VALTWLPTLVIGSDVMAEQKAICMRGRNVRHHILLDLKLVEEKKGQGD
jgi:hypothetical protein